MKSKNRSILIAVAGLFGAGFVHSLLPSGDIWSRAAVAGIAAIVISTLITFALSQRPKP